MNTQNFPVIFMGDFNAEPNDDLISNLSKHMIDAKTISKVTPFGPNATFKAFKPLEPTTRRIDYIMLSKSSKFKVKNYITLYDENAAQYPSDHFPVLAKLSF